MDMKSNDNVNPELVGEVDELKKKLEDKLKQQQFDSITDAEIDEASREWQRKQALQTEYALEQDSLLGHESFTDIRKMFEIPISTRATDLIKRIGKKRRKQKEAYAADKMMEFDEQLGDPDAATNDDNKKVFIDKGKIDQRFMKMDISLDDYLNTDSNDRKAFVHKLRDDMIKGLEDSKGFMAVRYAQNLVELHLAEAQRIAQAREDGVEMRPEDDMPISKRIVSQVNNSLRQSFHTKMEPTLQDIQSQSMGMSM